MINISTFKDPPITTHIKLKPHKTHQNKLKKKENQKGIKKKKKLIFHEPVKQGLIGGRTKHHAGMCRITILSQELQLLPNSHMEHLRVVLKNSTEELPHHGTWLQRRVQATELTWACSSTCSDKGSSPII